MRKILPLLLFFALVPAAQATELAGADEGPLVLRNSPAAWDSLQNMGGTWVRLVMWHMGRIPGENYDAAIAEADRRGMKIYMTLKARNVNVLRAYMQRWPSVDAWALGNEPELKTGTQSACWWKRRWNAASQMVHAEFPGRLFIAGENSPHGAGEYLAAVNNCPGELWIDGWALHPYQFKTPPTSPRSSEPAKHGTWWGIGRLPEFAQLLGWSTSIKGYSGPVLPWITEFAYSVRGGQPDRIIPVKRAAKWYPEAINVARSVGAPLFTIYGFGTRRRGGFDTFAPGLVRNSIAGAMG